MSTPTKVTRSGVDLIPALVQPPGKTAVIVLTCATAWGQRLTPAAID